MKFNSRRIIYKIPFLHNLAIFFVEMRNFRFYIQLNRRFRYDLKIKKLKNCNKKKRCFIIGNGPSLTMEDLNLVKNEDCFGSNLIYKVFPKTKWRPKYYFIQDPYANTGLTLKKMDIEHVFVGDSYWLKHKIEDPNAICFHTKRNYNKRKISFSNDISKKIISNYTITYSAIQAAVYFGYTEIYLIGMDHNYSFVVNSKGKVFKNDVKNHIFDDENVKEVVANLEGMNESYIAAKKYCELHGITILNATRGGKLNWFDRVSLEKILGVQE